MGAVARSSSEHSCFLPQMTPSSQAPRSCLPFYTPIYFQLCYDSHSDFQNPDLSFPPLLMCCEAADIWLVADSPVLSISRTWAGASDGCNWHCLFSLVFTEFSEATTTFYDLCPDPSLCPFKATWTKNVCMSKQTSR